MNESKFNISIKDSLKLLKDFKLFKSNGVKPIGQYSDEIKKVSKENNHSLIYKIAIKNYDYEILLEDDSIFQFSFGNEIRYAFIQNPYNYVTRKSYVLDLFSHEDLQDMDKSNIEEMFNSIDEEEFQQYVNEQELNINSNFIRYDAGIKGYKPLNHSFSHIHIGLNEHLRISCSLLLTPMKFVMFCLKNTYYDIWTDFFNNNEKFDERILICKKQCRQLNEINWSENESYELHLN